MYSARIIGGLIAASEADREAAEACIEKGIHHIAAFHWQQSAEKRLKAAIVALGHPFDATHDITSLCEKISSILPDANWPEREDLLSLTRVSIEARYPLVAFGYRDPREVVTLRVAAHCRMVAETLVRTADRIIHLTRDSDPPGPRP